MSSEPRARSNAQALPSTLEGPGCHHYDLVAIYCCLFRRAPVSQPRKRQARARPSSKSKDTSPGKDEPECSVQPPEPENSEGVCDLGLPNAPGSLTLPSTASSRSFFPQLDRHFLDFLMRAFIQVVMGQDAKKFEWRVPVRGS